MSSIVCFFPWLPRNYDYVGGFLAVFNISPDLLVSVGTNEQNHTVTFSVAFNLHQFYGRVLFFPFFGLNVLECFAYPKSPQHSLLMISPLPGMADNVIRLLSGLGAVLYHRCMCDTTPSTSDFRSDTIGVVLLLAPTRQQHLGYGQQVQTAGVAVPNVPAAGPNSGGPAFSIPTGKPAVPLQQPFPAPGYLQQQGSVLQPPVNFQGKQINGFRFNEACAHRRCGLRNDTPTMGLSSPQQVPVKEKHGDERPFGDPKAENPRPQVPKSKAPTSEGPKLDDPKSKSDDPKSKDSKSEATKSDDPKSENPKSEDPKSEDPKSDDQ